MANRRLSILALASAMCAAAISQVAAGFAAFPTLWQLIAMALSGAFALVTGTLSVALPGGTSKKIFNLVCKLQTRLGQLGGKHHLAVDRAQA